MTTSLYPNPDPLIPDLATLLTFAHRDLLAAMNDQDTVKYAMALNQILENLPKLNVEARRAWNELRALGARENICHAVMLDCVLPRDHGPLTVDGREHHASSGERWTKDRRGWTIHH